VQQYIAATAPASPHCRSLDFTPDACRCRTLSRARRSGKRRRSTLRCWRTTPCSGRRRSGATGAALPIPLPQLRLSPPLTLWCALGAACMHMMRSLLQCSHLLGAAGVPTGNRVGHALSQQQPASLSCTSPVQELLNRGNYHIFYVSQEEEWPHLDVAALVGKPPSSAHTLQPFALHTLQPFAPVCVQLMSVHSQHCLDCVHVPRSRVPPTIHA
jgi:hypothetical protein